MHIIASRLTILLLAVALLAPHDAGAQAPPAGTVEAAPVDPTPDLQRRRRQIPGGAAAPFFSLPDAALPFAPQAGTQGDFGLPRSIGPVQPAPPRLDPLTDRIPVALEARYAQNGPAIRDGVHWRIFADRPEANGAYALIAESREPAPVIGLRPGGYIVHAAYGLVGQTRRIAIGAQPLREEIVFNAGALRLIGEVAGRRVPNARLSFDIFAGGLFDGGEPRLVRRQAPAGELITLAEGTYHVVSTFGDANATIRADVRIRAGRLTDATIHHRAATVSMRLVQGRAGGEPIGNAAWTVLTPGGDVIKESIGAYPNMVLQEGEYLAIARVDGRVFNRRFQVEAGKDLAIEVVAQ